MKTAPKFEVLDGQVRVITRSSTNLYDKLPAKVYSVMYSEGSGFYLQEDFDKFTDLPSKFYGSLKLRTKKIVTTFLDRATSTSVGIVGAKGMGKTNLAFNTCNKLLRKGYPVVRVNLPFTGPAFFSFIQSLGSCVILFDEFIKTYSMTLKGERTSSQVAQEQLLGLFDGTIPGKRLIIIADNEVSELSDLFVNRRLYYLFEYDSLEPEVITGYAKDQGLDSDNLEQLLDYARTNQELNFETLSTICEEHHRFGESIEEATKDLNTKTMGGAGIRVIVEKFTHDYFPDPKPSTTPIIYNSKSNIPINFTYLNSENDERSDNYYFEACDIVYRDDQYIMFQDSSSSALVKILDAKSTFVNPFTSMKEF